MASITSAILHLLEAGQFRLPLVGRATRGPEYQQVRISEATVEASVQNTLW
jgi:hypothetical protein